MTTEEDRADYLGGNTGAPLGPEERGDLDVARDLLADPSVWAMPRASLEDSVVAAIAAEAYTRRGGGSISRLRRGVYGAAAAAAAIVLAVAVTAGVTAGGSHAPRLSAALSATSLAPRAAGAATFTRTTSGWRIELRTTGLPRLDDGNYYEAWMKNGAGVLVAIGTFNQGPEVTLWSGVSPQDFPTITVTEQQANGTPASSGRRVLTGAASNR